MRDRFSTFPQCLETLYARTNIPFDLLTIVGGADAATKDYLLQLQRRRENVHVVLTPSLLTQQDARRVVMQQLDEKFGTRSFCVILENDTLVHDNWLPPLLECMR